ncbi:MAG: hypothetical protein EXX96DRAFT_583706 [Benjaminiella poitrasii]|nr:MAG: hypothetical protein EXX96DRAFT_583706 [Benjaminiella poitrasii]
MFQFVDPLIVMRECHRPVSFLIAAKSMKQKAIGFLASLVHPIPVMRPQDLAETGHGRIHLLNPKTDPLKIHGIDTQFTQQFQPNDAIILPRNSGKIQIVKIISDTELVIKSAITDKRALEHLTRPSGSAYKCLPHIDQDAVYERVYEELHNGRCITIFPEGGSHDRAELLPFKAGVTIMALGAMAKYPGLDVKIVPCGLNYFHAHKFRSRAVIEFGKPITISADLVEKFKMGGQEKREACSSLLDTIFYALKAVTVNVPNDQTLMCVQAARRLYKPAAHRRLHIAQVVDLNRRFVIGYNLYKDDPRVVDLQQKVLAYNQLLKYHGLRDHQVPEINLRGWRTFCLLWYRIGVLIVWALLSFPGSILNLPIVITAKALSAKKAKEALKSSSVKIRGRDVLATWKFLVGLVLIPLLYGLYTLIVFWICLKSDMGWFKTLLYPLLTWTMLPFVSYASMRFAENGVDVFKSIRPLYLALVDPAASANLRQLREKLSQDITAVINEIGPAVFSDFDSSNVFRSDSTSEEAVSELASGGRTFSQIASEFLTGTANVLLHDSNIFNWTRQEEESDSDEQLYFLDKTGNTTTTNNTSASTSDVESSK